MTQAGMTGPREIEAALGVKRGRSLALTAAWYVDPVPAAVYRRRLALGTALLVGAALIAATILWAADRPAYGTIYAQIAVLGLLMFIGMRVAFELDVVELRASAAGVSVHGRWRRSRFAAWQELKGVKMVSMSHVGLCYEFRVGAVRTRVRMDEPGAHKLMAAAELVSGALRAGTWDAPAESPSDAAISVSHRGRRRQRATEGALSLARQESVPGSDQGDLSLSSRMTGDAPQPEPGGTKGTNKGDGAL